MVRKNVEDTGDFGGERRTKVGRNTSELGSMIESKEYSYLVLW